MGCGICQDRLDQLGCVQEDDFAQLVDQMLEADVTVFSTPIYACFPPGPVKIFLDRLIYAPIKLYGKEKAPSLLAGKACAVIITGGGVGDDLTLVAILHAPDLHAVQLPGPDQFMQALGFTPMRLAASWVGRASGREAHSRSR